MLIPAAVRAPALAWFTALGAGAVETLLHVALPEPPGAGEVAVRGIVYLAVIALVLALSTGRDSVRWALTIVLGGVGTLSLLIEPVSWLVGGGSPVEFLADADAATLGIAALRTLHVVAVITAVVLMFRPRAAEFFAAASGRPVDLGDRPGPLRPRL